MKKHTCIPHRGSLRGIFSIICLAALFQCSCRELPQSPVVILFDNDVHCAVEGYAAMLSLKQQKQQETPYVATVSCGDFVQGDVIGVISRGEKVIDIMNQVGYDFVTLGNHEFDYGMPHHTTLMEKLNAKVVCSNFMDLESSQPVYAPYEIVRYGNVDVAFIGIVTPATATSVSPTTFIGEDGETRYTFCKDDFYNTVQQNVNKAKADGADYVVAMAHLGDTPYEAPYEDYPTSVSLIANTCGIDVLLDGHAHSVIPDSIILNSRHKPVHLVSSGIQFKNIGVLTLSTNGEFSAELVPVKEIGADAGVAEFIGKIKEELLAEGERVIGESKVDMPALDAAGNWLVRGGQTVIGTFCADAFRTVLGTDIAMINGGGIRAGIAQGPITFNDLLAVFPFNNTACTATITGEQLLDALEVSNMYLPERDGSYMQVSGIRYKTDPSVPSPVVLGADKLFSHVAPGPRRVSDVEILDKETGEYIPLDPSRTYTMAGISYNVVDLGSNGIFRYVHLLESNLGQDVEILVSYLLIVQKDDVTL